jgi:SAM-dependent methyltransferase
MSDLTFRDLFSEHASEYARFRPTYPPELFEQLAAECRSTHLAWDCATGNGQAAVPLANHFEQVIATDASEDQIAHAMTHSRVTYRVAPAESSALEAGSVDLICCAQAAHWLDLNRFYAEVRRVSAPGAVIALITYALPQIEKDIDGFVQAFTNRIVGPFWPPERRHIDSAYATLEFPFPELELPRFTMEATWTADEFLAYAGTWSATRAYIRLMEFDPRDLIRPELVERWGSERRKIVWPLTIRAGRVK